MEDRILFENGKYKNELGKDDFLKVIDVTGTNEICIIQFVNLINNVYQLKMEPGIIRISHPSSNKLTIEYRKMPFSLTDFVISDLLEEYITIFTEISESVKKLSDAGLIHGNLKPSNIRFDSFSYYIVDYGLHDIRCFTTIPLDYYNCISPEQINGKEVTVKTDIYSLGCILYYIISKDHYYSESSWKTIMKIANPGKKTVKIDERYDDIIERMIEYNPDKRISIDELIICLNKEEKSVDEDDTLVRLLKCNACEWCAMNRYEIDINYFKYYCSMCEEKDVGKIFNYLVNWYNNDESAKIDELFNIINMVWCDGYHHDGILQELQPHLYFEYNQNEVSDELIIKSVKFSIMDLCDTEFNNVKFDCFLSNIHRLTYLKSLDLSSNNLSSNETIRLSKCLDSLPNVTEVNLQYNNINTDGWKYWSKKLPLLTYYDYGPNIVVFHGSSTGLNNEGLSYINEYLSTITEVQFLSMAYNKFDDDDDNGDVIKDFSDNCKMLTKLTVLALFGNKGSERVGVRHFHQLKSLLPEFVIGYTEDDFEEWY